MTNRVLVLGANGMLGRYVVRYFANQGHFVVGYSREDLDAEYDKGWTLIDKLEQHKPTAIINCIGLIKQRNVSNRQMQKINADFPLELSSACYLMMVPLIHVSTDCVYDGTKGDYTEHDQHTAIDVYGKSKSQGEPEDCTVIRTSIIGEEPLGKKLSLLEWVKSQSKKTVNGFLNHYWNGITCLQLAKVMETIVVKNLYWQGVRHIHSPLPVSKYELIKIINDIYKFDITINPTDADSFCDRTLKSEFEECSLFSIPDLWHQVREMKDFKLI